jgi:quercetin dioxygenase-like cupin family protein
MDAQAYRWTEVAEDKPIPLLTRRKITTSQMLVARVLLEKGCYVAQHAHDSEQVAMIVSGRVRWALGEKGTEAFREYEMGEGEVMLLPSNVPHGVTALEDTLIIDVLSPAAAMGIDSQGRL